jgi:hypothetical protein
MSRKINNDGIYVGRDGPSFFQNLWKKSSAILQRWRLLFFPPFSLDSFISSLGTCKNDILVGSLRFYLHQSSRNKVLAEVKHRGKRNR